MARYCGREELPDARRRRVARGFLPPLGLLHEQPHEERDACRQQTEQEHVAPGRFGTAGEIYALHLIGDDRGQKQSERCGRIQERARLDTALLGHDFRHHRCTCGPLPADAERRDDAEEHERCHVRRERTRSRSNRIHQHRQEQRSRAAEPIGDATEKDAADRPANQQQRGENARPSKSRGARGGRSERNVQQHGDCVRRDIVEEKTVEDVEAPSQPGGEQHRPLVGVHVEQRASGRRGRDLSVMTPLSGFSLDHERSPFASVGAAAFVLV